MDYYGKKFFTEKLCRNGYQSVVQLNMVDSAKTTYPMNKSLFFEHSFLKGIIKNPQNYSFIFLTSLFLGALNQIRSAARDQTFFSFSNMF